MEALQLDMFDLLVFEDDSRTSYEPPAWTEDEVRMLHEWLLVRSLETLAAATRPDVIQDILGWVNGPINDPFAFRTCCAVAGYDWEELRDGINSIHKYAGSM